MSRSSIYVCWQNYANVFLHLSRNYHHITRDWLATATNNVGIQKWNQFLQSILALIKSECETLRAVPIDFHNIRR